ncbi:MAG: hypothetical protein ACJZ8O_06470 [Pirellulaceae bacterium]
MSTAANDRESQARVFVLGASNVVRGCDSLVSHLCSTIGPCQIHLAGGRGRSYGRETRFLGTEFIGHTDSTMWQAACQPSDIPSVAFLTDIGNDIAYGSPPDELLAWVTTVIERLSEHCEHIAISRLPTGSIARLGRFRFWVLKTFFFRGTPLQFSDIMNAVDSVNDGLEQLSQEYPITLVEPETRWYSPDIIHIKSRRYATAWKSMMAPIVDFVGASTGQIVRYARKQIVPRREFNVLREITLPCGSHVMTH